MPERSLIDISRTVSPATAVWPGDTEFSRSIVMGFEQGDAVEVSTYRLSAHTATHVDAPSHFEPGAPTMEAVDLEAFIGPCRVIAAREPHALTAADLEAIDLEATPRVLVRSQRPPTTERWDPEFSYVEPAAARRLAAAGVRLIGVDTPSVDPMTSKTMEAHKALLSGGVAILEGLDLGAVEPGAYELIALPLKIAGGDASPVRAVLRPL